MMTMKYSFYNIYYKKCPMKNMHTELYLNRVIFTDTFVLNVV